MKFILAILILSVCHGYYIAPNSVHIANKTHGPLIKIGYGSCYDGL